MKKKKKMRKLNSKPKVKAKTNIKKAQKKPMTKAKAFKEYYGNLHLPVIVLDGQFRAIYLNEVAEDLLSYSLADLKNRQFHEIFKKDYVDIVRSAIELVGTQKGVASQEVGEVILTKKSGRKVHVEFSVKYLEQLNKLVVTLHDLSPLIKSQKAKEKYEKELNHISKLADIGRLTAGVAHELNNPLMIIRGFAENIQMLFEQDSFERDEILAQVNPILKATDRMTKIISTMMKFARDDDVYMVHVDLWEVVEDALSFLRPLLHENNVVVERKMNSPLGVVKCDPNQIEQIILNIVGNAIHALHDNDLEDRKISISLDLDEQVKLSIWNNGPVIPQGIQERIMTPFFTTKEVGEGTGLGLSLSYGIMKAHDGELSFESSKKEGTVFRLTFPFAGVDENVKKVKVKRKVLVVDDEKFIADLLEHKLARYGYEVIVAYDGEQGKKVFDENPGIECIFTDIRMPRVDGLEFIKHVRQKNKDILVYAISGYVGKKSMELQVKRLGINGFLTKPIDHLLFSKVISTIEEHFNYIGKEKRFVS